MKQGFVTLTSGLVVTILLLLVFSLIMMGFLNRASDVYRDTAYDAACVQFIESAIVMARSGLIYADPDAAQCRVKNVEIEARNSFDVLDGVFSNMESCYNTFHRGEHRLFRAEGRSDITYCGFCHKISFDGPEMIITTEQYLAGMTSMRSSTREPFMEVFAPTDFSRQFTHNSDFREQYLRTIGSDVTVINTSEEYLTTFLYRASEGADLGWVKRSLNFVTDTTAGAVTSGLFGFSLFNREYEYSTGIYLVEFSADELSELNCDVTFGIQQPGITNPTWS